MTATVSVTVEWIAINAKRALDHHREAMTYGGEPTLDDKGMLGQVPFDRVHSRRYWDEMCNHEPWNSIKGIFEAYIVEPQRMVTIEFKLYVALLEPLIKEHVHASNFPKK